MSLISKALKNWYNAISQLPMFSRLAFFFLSGILVLDIYELIAIEYTARGLSDLLVTVGYLCLFTVAGFWMLSAEESKFATQVALLSLKDYKNEAKVVQSFREKMAEYSRVYVSSGLLNEARMRIFKDILTSRFRTASFIYILTLLMIVSSTTYGRFFLAGSLFLLITVALTATREAKEIVENAPQADYQAHPVRRHDVWKHDQV